MPNALITETAVSLLGVDAVRLGTPADAVEGVVPRVIVEPASGEAVGSVLEWASREKLCVLVRGVRHEARLGRCAAPDRHPDFDRAAECGRRPSSRRFDGHHSGGRDARRRQSSARPAPPVDSARSAVGRSRDDRRPRGDQRQRPAPASVRRAARSDHRRRVRARRRTPRERRRHRRQERRRLRSAAPADGIVRQPRRHHHGDLQAVSADRGITDAHRRAVEPVRSRRAGGEAVGEPPDADRARVCDPSAAPHHQVRIDRGVCRSTVRDRIEADRRERIRGANAVGIGGGAVLAEPRDVSRTTIVARC